MALSVLGNLRVQNVEDNDSLRVEFDSFSINASSSVSPIRFRVTSGAEVSLYDVFQIAWLRSTDSTKVIRTAVPSLNFYIITAIEHTLNGYVCTASPMAYASVSKSGGRTTINVADTITLQKITPTYGVGYIIRPSTETPKHYTTIIGGWTAVSKNVYYKAYASIIATKTPQSLDSSEILCYKDEITDDYAVLPADDATKIKTFSYLIVAQATETETSEFTYLSSGVAPNVIGKKIDTPVVAYKKTRLTDRAKCFARSWVDGKLRIEGRFPSEWGIGDLFTIAGHTTIFKIVEIEDTDDGTAVVAEIDTEGTLKSSSVFTVPCEVIPYDIKQGTDGVLVTWGLPTTNGRKDSQLEYNFGLYLIEIKRDGEFVEQKVVRRENGQNLISEVPRSLEFIFEQEGEYEVAVKTYSSAARDYIQSDFGKITFTLKRQEPEVIMAGDTFGAAQIGRAQQNGRFYSIRETDVPANTVFMPGYSTSPFFGVNEVPIPANKLGAYATTGIFCFDFPDGWTSVEGQAVYYKPTSATEGTFSATSSTGAVRIGFEVFQPNVAGKLCVYIQPGAGLES